jgi:hypothetical protein
MNPTAIFRWAGKIKTARHLARIHR